MVKIWRALIVGQNTGESQLDAVKRLAGKHYRRKRGELADAAGVPRNTVQKILMGYTRQPLSGTLQRLYDVLAKAEAAAEKVDAKAKRRLGAEAGASTGAAGSGC
jgi:transcriptional regulator with XRE-family HTH domain